MTANFHCRSGARGGGVFSAGNPAIVSVFAGRIADTGRDPEPLMREFPVTAVPFAACRINVGESARSAEYFSGGCIGVSYHHRNADILGKLAMVGKDPALLSLEAVKAFYADATAAGFSIEAAAIAETADRFDLSGRQEVGP